MSEKNKKIWITILCCIVFLGLGNIGLNSPSIIEKELSDTAMLAGMQLSIVTVMSIGVGPYLLADITMSIICKVSPFFKKLRAKSKKEHWFISTFKFVISNLYAGMQIVALLGAEKAVSLDGALLLLGTLIAFGLAKCIEFKGIGAGWTSLIAVNIVSGTINLIQMAIMDAAYIDLLYYIVTTVVGVFLWAKLQGKEVGVKMRVKQDEKERDLNVKLKLLPNILYPIILLNLCSTIIDASYREIVLIALVTVFSLITVVKAFNLKTFKKELWVLNYDLINEAEVKIKLRKLIGKSSAYLLTLLLVSFLSLEILESFGSLNLKFYQSTISIMFIANMIISISSLIKNIEFKEAK